MQGRGAPGRVLGDKLLFAGAQDGLCGPSPPLEVGNPECEGSPRRIGRLARTAQGVRAPPPWLHLRSH
jgi:hypothetical protein